MMFKRFNTSSSAKKKSIPSFLLPLLFLLTFFLIIFNKTDYFLIDKVKGYGVDYLLPVTKVISSPITTISNISLHIQNIQYLENENLQLKEEIIRLKKWQTLAIKNSRENRVFKKLLNSTSHQVDIIKTASVINQTPGLYTKQVIINAGLNYNVVKDLAVINEKGLVGKTILSTNSNSKVLLINDSSSSIPVKTLSDNSYSMLTGSADGKFLISSYTQNNKLPRVGDLLVTSGNAKIFPRDILVAKVIKVNADHYIALPYVDFNNLNYLQVVKSK
ncbi:rod shape-determining protein MreC [Alphaproteobacteria bacterium]|nr:rod shape-determining protein MreC [Alphaproteobacteria bacterium]